MKDQALQNRIKELTASIQQELGEEELPVIKFYHSGDELINNLLLTTDNKGLSAESENNNPNKIKGSSSPSGKGVDNPGESGSEGEGKERENDNPGNDDQPAPGEDDTDTTGINLPEDEGDGKDGQGGDGKDGKGKDDGQDGKGDDDSDKSGEGKDGNDKIKIGSKVKIKSTGKDGKVVAKNEDGTFKVEEIDSQQKKFGGAIEILAVGAIIGKEILGDFPETDLEVIEPESKGGGKGDKGKPGKGKGKGKPGQGEGQQGEGHGEPGEGQQGQGQGQPPPLVINRDDLRGRLNALQNVQLKLPTFAYAFFGARMDLDNNSNQSASGLLFNMQSELALLNRYARGVFSKKNPMSTENAVGVMKVFDAYRNLVVFIKGNAKFIDGVYFYDFDTPSYRIVSQSIDTGDDAQLLNAYQWLAAIDSLINLDARFYRFMSLSAFLNKELFGSEFLKIHLDYMFRYLRVTKIPFLNSSTLLFVANELTFELLYNNAPDSLTIFTTMRTQDRENFIVLEFQNIINRRNALAVTTYNKYVLSPMLSNLLFDSNDKNSDLGVQLFGQLRHFYQSALNFRDNSSFKETVMKNIEFLLNLQNDKVRMPLSDFLLEVSIA